MDQIFGSAFIPSPMTVDNFDALLNGWIKTAANSDPVPKNFKLGARASSYSCKAKDAFKTFTDPVSDGGKGWSIDVCVKTACPVVCP